MKRLIKNRTASIIKKSDAARLHDINIDPQLAIQAIAGREQGFTQEKIIKDAGASKFAYWGAICDDGRYLTEAYMFDGVQNQRKVAFVTAQIQNGQLQNSLEVSIYNIEGATEIRQMAKSGLTLNSGEKITFQNEYSSIDQLPQQQQEGQPPKAASKK